ncbi:MAG: hypothetical protein AAGL49_04360 [Pseudomonadota bacterium]
MRRLYDEEAIDLHILVRYFCRHTGLSFTAFSAAAIDAYDGPRGEWGSSPARDINNFLHRGTVRAIHRYAECITNYLGAELRAAGPLNSYDLAEVLGEFIASRTYREHPGARRFFEIEAHRTMPYLVPALARRDVRVASPAAAPAPPEKNIGKAFQQLAATFDAKNRDVQLLDERFFGRFICLRSSSETPERFVAHGLKIDRHDDNPDMMYFSEKYFLRKPGGETQGRKSQGIMFVDGEHAQAWSRPDHAHTFTYLAARAPQGDSISSFRGLMFTSNSSNLRISANVLCLRCASKAEKHERMGLYDLAELLATFAPAAGVIEAWLRERNMANEGVLRLAPRRGDETGG